MKEIRLLIVSKLFAPAPSARAYQIGKVVKAIVLYGNVKATIFAGLESTTETHLLEQNHNEYGANVSINYVTYSPKYITYSSQAKGRGLLSRVVRRLVTEWGMTSAGSEWVQNAISGARMEIQENGVDVILTSSTPFDSHLVGLFLAKEFNIPWVASFSDPWPSSYMPAPYGACRLPILSRLQERRVRSVMEHCSAVHMPNQFGIGLMEKMSGVCLGRKGYSIPHVANMVKRAEGSPLIKDWLVHVGSLDRERVSVELVEAIKRVRSVYRRKFNGLMLVGPVCQEFRDLVSSLGAEDCVKYIGTVSPEMATEISGSAYALLVMEANMPSSPFLPSKFADYACIGRPIIAVTPEESPIREYLGRFGGGIAVSHDSDEIEKVLTTIFVNYRQRPIDSNKAGLCSEFSLQTVGQRYRAMFESILDMGGKLPTDC